MQKHIEGSSEIKMSSICCRLFPPTVLGQLNDGMVAQETERLPVVSPGMKNTVGGAIGLHSVFLREIFHPGLRTV